MFGSSKSTKAIYNLESFKAGDNIRVLSQAVRDLITQELPMDWQQIMSMILKANVGTHQLPMLHNIARTFLSSCKFERDVKDFPEFLK